MDKIQILSTIGSIVLIVFIVALIRNRRLKEEYSLLWLFFSFIFLVLSIWKDALEWFASAIGISYAPAALFLILIMTIFVIMIEFSMIISKQSEWIKRSAQHIGIVNLEISDLEQKNRDLLSRMDKFLHKGASSKEKKTNRAKSYVNDSKELAQRSKQRISKN